MKNLLSQLIMHRSNDVEDEDIRYHMTELIIGVVRYLHDIRYCSNKKCQCSPEYKIKHHYESIKEYLQKTQYALYPIPWWEIEDVLKKE